MFQFLNRTRSRRSSRRKNQGRRLRFETLEGRCVPSAAPVIDALAMYEMPWGGIGVTGHVVDESPEGLTVTLTGAVQGCATVESDGDFSFTISGGQVGPLSATVVDWDYQQSEVATVQFTSNVPMITGFTVTEGACGTVIVTGCVSDESPGGLTVDIAGVVQGSATVDSDGSFSAIVSGNGQLGEITATVADWFGQQSAEATAQLVSLAPEIGSLNVFFVGDYELHVQGQVTDESPECLAIVVTWLGESYSVCASGDGCFEWSCTIQAGQNGTVTAQTTDWWTLTSNVASEVV
jgi:hypothetical protein